MKILIDARFYGLEHAGLGRYTINLIDELKKLQTSNSYVVLLRDKYYKELILPDNWKKVLCDIPHYSIKEQLLLPGKIYKEKPDVFHALQINYPFFYFGKSVVTVHDLTQLEKKYEATTLPKPLYLIKLRALRLLFNTKIKRANKIIVPTKQVKDEVSQRGVSSYKIQVVYEGISEKFLKKRQPPGLNSKTPVVDDTSQTDRYFIYVGNAYPHKNLEKAIDAVAILNKESNEKIMLYLVSARDSFTRRINNYVRDNNAEDYVKHFGYISDDELITLLSKASGFVYPSLKEGFGLQGLEVMAVGTPLLASNIPVFKEIYDDCAIFFDPSDVLSIKEAMKYVLTMSDKSRKLLTQKGKSFVKRYSWKKMAEETLSVYKKVASS